MRGREDAQDVEPVDRREIRRAGLAGNPLVGVHDEVRRGRHVSLGRGRGGGEDGARKECGGTEETR